MYVRICILSEISSLSLSHFHSTFLLLHFPKGWRRTYCGERMQPVSEMQTLDIWHIEDATVGLVKAEKSEGLMATWLASRRHDLPSEDMRGINWEGELDSQQRTKIWAWSPSVQKGVVPKYIVPLCAMSVSFSHISSSSQLQNSWGSLWSISVSSGHHTAWHMADPNECYLYEWVNECMEYSEVKICIHGACLNEPAQKLYNGLIERASLPLPEAPEKVPSSK